jgi:hypothetical protein
MDNLVVLHTRHALELLRVLLGLLKLLGNQLLQVLYRVLQLCSLSLTRLELLISLVQLSLEVVDIAMGSGQLVLSVLQLGAAITEKVGLEVTVVISHHQLIVQLLDTCLKVGVFLKKLLGTLLNVPDGSVFGLHLIGILLQAKALVGARRRDLLKHGAHMLSIACHERPTHVVGRKLGVANGGHALTPHRITLILNGEQGDGDAVEARQVVLIKLREGLVGISF